MPELLLVRRGEEVLRFTLDRRRMILGRGEDCDLVLPDPGISRHQVAVCFDGQRTLIEDLSGKGTMVGGTTVQKIELSAGMDIVLGPWRAVYRDKVSGDLKEAATLLSATKTDPLTAETSVYRFQPAQLRIRQGHTERTHPLIGDTFWVGSDASNEIVVGDKFISGKHVQLTRKDGLFVVTDHRSTNGTFIGGVRIHEAQVPLFTTLRAGETELVLEPVPPDDQENAFLGIIGKDPYIRQLAELIERVAPSSAAIAIFGESGTGKELVARAVHAKSLRAERAFVPVNCAAISQELMESELFGHEKGAFTGAINVRRGAFEEANGGTLFLDEIGELPLSLQPKLLRALESGEIKRVGAARPSLVDVRVVVATNRNLLEDIRANRFREDLYYRLCVVPLHLPPLRNRQGDIAAVAEHFVRLFSPKGQQIRFTAAALKRLQKHPWPGNVRELRNVVHRALLLRKGPMIDDSDINFDEEVHPQVGVAVPEFPPGMTMAEMLEKLERQIIESSLRRYNNSRDRVAKELGVARSTLFKKLREWGITQKDEAE